MVRVKKGLHALKRKRNILRRAKGYRHARSKKERAAKEALLHAGAYAFAHRRDKKNDFRRLWNVQLNAALRETSWSYSRFIGALKKKGVVLDRKILSGLAKDHPKTFERLVQKISLAGK